MSMQKRSWQRVDGVLLLDKAAGMSSNQALQKARRLYSAAKAGHTGTLDPMATGLLPLCFGEATKFSADLLDADKTYEAELLFGVTTDSGDAEGRILQTQAVTFSLAGLEAVLPRFRGPISQIPPMHSALKRDGRPLYELARQGIEVERAPRAVIIHSLQLLDFSGERCRLRVHCSKGTYIRTLAQDIGNALACGAHLTALRRTGVGPLHLADALTLEQLEALPEEARETHLLPADRLLQSLPAIRLDAERADKFRHGNPVVVPDAGEGSPCRCRVYAADGLLGIGELREGLLHPRRLVSA